MTEEATKIIVRTEQMRADTYGCIMDVNRGVLQIGIDIGLSSASAAVRLSGKVRDRIY